MARKRKTSRAQKSKAQVKRVRKSPRQTGERGNNISRSIQKHSESVARIGRKRLPSGSYLIGKSGFLTPSKRGMGTVKRIVSAIRKVESPSTFTYKLRIKQPSGRIVEITPRPANIIPRHVREQKIGAKLKSAKSTSARTRALHELFQERIRSEVFANRVTFSKSQSEAYKQLRLKSKKKAKAYLEKIRGGRGITFQIEVYREI